MCINVVHDKGCWKQSGDTSMYWKDEENKERNRNFDTS